MKRTTRWLALALSLVMVVCQFAIFAMAETAEASEIIVYAKNEDGTQSSAFTKLGTVAESGVTVDGRGTYYVARNKTGGFIFDMGTVPSGHYAVYYYGVAAATAAMSVDVKIGDTVALTATMETRTTSNTAEWLNLGTIALNADSSVTLQYDQAKVMNARATAVKLVPVDDGSIVVYADEEGFTGTGKWRDSSKSVNGHATVYSSNGSAAGFTFDMGTVPSGDYEVYYYSFADSAAMELQVNIKNSAAFTKTVEAIPSGEADAGWVKLGNVELAVNNTVSVVYESAYAQNARATAVKLVPVTGQESEGTMVVYTDSEGFTKMGNWGASSYAVDGHESYYLYNGSNMSGSFTFDFGTVQPGTYEVYYYSFYNASTMTLEVSVGDEVQFEKALVAVEDDPAALGWASLGRVTLEAADTVAVSLPTTTIGNVRASAAKLVPVDESQDPKPIEGGVTVYACEDGKVNEEQLTIFPKTALEYDNNSIRLGWVYSDLKVDGHDTLVTMLQGAKCSFTFDQSALTPGTYKVYYYASRVVPEMTFSVKEGGSLIGKVFKDAIYSTTSNANIGAVPEWVDCGNITVMGVGDVVFDYQTGSAPIEATNARATAVKLVPIEAATPSEEIENAEGMYMDTFAYSGDWQATTVPEGPLDDYPTTMWIDRATIDGSDVTTYEYNYCQYAPKLESRTAKVYVWLDFWPYGQANQVIYEVHSGENVETFTFDMTTVTESGWYQLGTESFAFTDDEASNFVRLVCTDADNYGKDTTFRASTVRFNVDPLEDGSGEIHDYSFVRYVSPNPENRDMTYVELGALSDISEEDPLYDDIFYMYNEGFVSGTTDTTFAPDEAVKEADFITYLGNVLTKYNVTYTEDQLQAGVDLADEDETLTKEELAVLLYNAFSADSKHTEWLESLNVDYAAIKDIENISDGAMDAVDLLYRVGILTLDEEGKLLPQQVMSRGDATVILKDFTMQFIQVSPTVDTEDDWVLTFNDEFQGTELNYDVWSSSDQDFGNLLGSRHPENVEVHGGAAHLVTKYESRYEGKYWTTADIFADKVFAQEYGYWECRYKIAAAPNTNNSFWCMSPSGTPNENRYEVDINEGQWPNYIANTFHENRTNNGALYSQSKWTRSDYDLFEDYHTYACKWDAEHIYYYFDGELTHTVNTTCGGSQSWPRLSTAILKRDSIKINPDEHDGTEMVVDYVRIWQRASDLEQFTTAGDGALDDDGTKYSMREYLANQDPCAKGHTEETIAGKAATCTETGLTEGKKCTVCGVTTVEQEEIPLKSHRWSSVVVTSATCTEDGYITITCGNCGKVAVSGKDAEADQYLIDNPYFQLGAKGHDFTIFEGKEATCTETGLTEGKDCSRCDIADVAQEEIPALGHSRSLAEDGSVVCGNCGMEMSAHNGMNLIGGTYYLFAEGKLADTVETGLLYQWNTYGQLVLIGGRPAANGVYTINGEQTYVYNHKPANRLMAVKDAALAEAFGIETGKSYLFVEGQLADTEKTGLLYDWTASYPQLIMSRGRPAANGVYTINGEQCYVLNNQLANKILVANAAMAEAFGIEAGKSYLFAEGKLADSEESGLRYDWSGYKQLIMSGGRPAANGVYTIGGETIYVVNNLPANKIVLIKDAVEAEALGITAGKNYLFVDGKLADTATSGLLYDWGGYKQLVMVNGRPA
ncbi:MAG: family 16 glycosylhydrolase [Clostridia bacterium]|nr:family 16 glycosylhydrolase [Clostridia bacterium]